MTLIHRKNYWDLFQRSLKHRLNEILMENNSIVNEIVLINIRRMYYFALMAIPFHIACVLLFWMVSPGSENEIRWKTGISMIHGIQVIIMGIFAACLFILRKKDTPSWWMHLLQYAFIVMLLIVGISLTAVDQYVTTNITPFLMVCMLLGILFLMRPGVTVLVYVSALGIFYYTIGLLQKEPAILMTNRINGIAFVTIGIFLSLMLWNTNRMNLQQKKKIEKQQQELEEKNQELERLAYLDTLTGLYNRRKWIGFVNEEIERMLRFGHEASIIIMDLDHFKKVNDVYGHPVGDIVLKEMADMLMKQLRSVDKASRWGGEEFISLLPQTSLTEGMIVAEKLRGFIEKRTFNINNHELRITASFGVSSLTCGKDSFEKSYSQADKALYLAKQNGRNRVEVGV